MAKVTFNSLGLKLNQEVKTITIKEKNIEIKQYLPIQNKLEIIANVINNSQDDNNFKNVAKVEMFTDLEIINQYTNLSFTEKQKEEPWKIYDILINSGVMKEIRKAIPEDELRMVYHFVDDATERIYEYRNSAYAILDSLKTDYNVLDFDAEAIRQKLADGENVEFLKDVLTKLG